MGAYTSEAIERGMDEWRSREERPMPFWPSETKAGKPIHPATFEQPKACRKCGYHFLFWRKVEGKWRLHHYAQLAGKAEPEFVLHRCGYSSDGSPKARGTEPSGFGGGE